MSDWHKLHTANRIIFLDIDGVMNNYDTPQDKIWDHTGWTAEAIGCLRKVIHETAAAIVVSSTWRLDMGKVGWCMAKANLPCPKGRTSTDHSNMRGTQIAEWITKQKEIFYQPVKSYVILDDDSDMLSNQMNRFLRIDPTLGLQSSDISRMIDILKRDL